MLNCARRSQSTLFEYCWTVVGGNIWQQEHISTNYSNFIYQMTFIFLVISNVFRLFIVFILVKITFTSKVTVKLIIIYKLLSTSKPCFYLVSWLPCWGKKITSAISKSYLVWLVKFINGASLGNGSFWLRFGCLKVHF